MSARLERGSLRAVLAAIVSELGVEVLSYCAIATTFRPFALSHCVEVCWYLYEAHSVPISTRSEPSGILIVTFSHYDFLPLLVAVLYFVLWLNR